MKVPRPEDTEAGVRFLRKICYPHMNRFIDSKQEIGTGLKNYSKQITITEHKNIIKSN